MVPAHCATYSSSHLLRRDVALPGEELAYTVRPFSADALGRMWHPGASP
ncbi:hypothetical protein BKA23_3207 [Rudaeicoccus suwonensis]|uniref:Uncharacterized protein n=1 Tax=Rudaeicoccus suwonensis TaxID=657409 RepID=A0A561DWU0_9MICO|nr:hypothetical protein BKA23_3207 [Rudaeicoccus suwonensis]